MSIFEDYNSTCDSYDDNRQPIGADVVAGMIQIHGKKQLKDVHLLDAGCGTGNYAKALIGYGVGKVTLMDASSGMLRQARAKLVDAIAENTVVSIIKNKLPEMPFGDGTFDVVLFSLVLHHLNPDSGKDDTVHFQELEQTIAQARRVLRQNGVIVIITQSEDDLYNTWFYHINKEITKKYARKFASVRQYLEIFERVGVNCIQRMRLLGTLLSGHFHLNGPLEKSWRDCDSYWACATETELDDVKQAMCLFKEKGELNEWVIKHDRVNVDGIATMFVCK
ncbi:uncharacterized protein LOC123558820 [Mercenaria mercenaria]|uniref:uncharacterized protein LOC123558820 n=1 Tax=Mercenaria mercenaria TaxID=6596 RepID=UPI00234F3F46|nr:uncharacterized protein LOC123558820 [Mercenaria mercenaria]